MSGLSLIELNLVVATIAVIALMVVPARAPGRVAETDFAAVEVANALRFARDQALANGVPYGVRLSPDAQFLSLFRMAVSGSGETEVFDVYDPLRKLPFVVRLPQQTRGSMSWEGQSGGNPMVTVVNDGRGNCLDLNALIIDPSGITRCLNPYGTRIEGARLVLASGVYRRRVSIDRFTARVSLL